MTKKYHKIPWTGHIGEKNEEETYWVSETDNHVVAFPLTDKKGKTRLKIHCNICDEVLFKAISSESWQNWLSTREQRHFDSDQHRQNLVLDKLAGDAQE